MSSTENEPAPAKESGQGSTGTTPPDEDPYAQALWQGLLTGKVELPGLTVDYTQPAEEQK